MRKFGTDLYLEGINPILSFYWTYPPRSGSVNCLSVIARALYGARHAAYDTP